MSPPAVGVVIQGSRIPIGVEATSAIDPADPTATPLNMTTVTSVDLLVHRGVSDTAIDGTSTETWACVIDPTRTTPSFLAFSYAPTAVPAAGSLGVARERIIVRPVFHIAAAPDRYGSRFYLTVEVE